MKVRELHGYEITYNADTRRFEAWKDGESVTNAPTQAEVEEFIEKLHKKGFHRVKAIRALYGDDVDLGEITSIQKTGGWRELEAWFVSRDEKNQVSRQKIVISGLYQATPENLKVAQKIMELADKRRKLLDQIEGLKKKLKDPITKENVYKLAGLE